MAIKTHGGRGRKELATGHGSDGGGVVDTGLPLLPPDPQGGQWRAPIRYDAAEQPTDPSVRDDARGSPARGEWQDSFKTMFGDRRGLRAGGVGHRADSERVEESSIRNFGPVELAQLPDVPDRYLEPLEETDSETADDGFRDGDGILDPENNYKFLARLRAKALKKIDEILDLPIPARSDINAHIRMASIQKDAANGIIGNSLKADENCFRQRHTDALDRLYAAVEADMARKQNGQLTQPLVIDQPVEAVTHVTPLPA